MNNSHFQLSVQKGAHFAEPYTSARYHILLFRGEGSFLLDFTKYHFSGNTVLFFAPFQTFVWMGDDDTQIDVLSFHGDFYCIEYHKKEVACNGLLFNNIYLLPHINVAYDEYVELLSLFCKIRTEATSKTVSSEAILRAYLQLTLALCSREKQQQMQLQETEIELNNETTDIQHLIDTHFLVERGAAFYASQLSMSASAFAKKTKQFFGKTPTQLIQDRVVLEAKKLLHLTHKSVKEIASSLNFDDEFYFSRYFKKNVGLSPSRYRNDAGISIAAK